eukprot:TRINITY_DN539_c0_g1_i2.p1 TRINITY_DN539_c0_g1~~TRINITY_DN539_c0_g1_i2.p1  ORF type:complete len:163 (+),score=4.60 TRINITY_DN539_c0_g1_i2:7-495(+)
MKQALGVARKEILPLVSLVNSKAGKVLGYIINKFDINLTDRTEHKKLLNHCVGLLSNLRDLTTKLEREGKTKSKTYLNLAEWTDLMAGEMATIAKNQSTDETFKNLQMLVFQAETILNTGETVEDIVPEDPGKSSSLALAIANLKGKNDDLDSLLANLEINI